MTDRGFDADPLVNAAFVMWRADIDAEPFGPALDSAVLLREWRRREALQQPTIVEVITPRRQDLAWHAPPSGTTAHLDTAATTADELWNW